MPHIIAIDWGTSSFRACQIDSDGKIIDKTHSDSGISKIPKGQFSEVMKKEISHFSHMDSCSILCSGMITSRQGWVETPYVESPCGIDQLVKELVKADFDDNCRLYFVPGVMQKTPHPDIMRGEETQLMGLPASEKIKTCILPGTHSKWVTMKAGRIISFATFLTGDLYHALLSRSILMHAVDSAKPDDSFVEGVSQGISAFGKNRGLLTELFSTRARSILLSDPHSGSRQFISGLLIGMEIAEARQQGMLERSPVAVIGNLDLTRQYNRALSYLGIDCESATEDIAAKGQFRIAQAHQLI